MRFVEVVPCVVCCLMFAVYCFWVVWLLWCSLVLGVCCSLLVDNCLLSGVQLLRIICCLLVVV